MNKVGITDTSKGCQLTFGVDGLGLLSEGLHVFVLLFLLLAVDGSIRGFLQLLRRINFLEELLHSRGQIGFGS